VLSFGAGAAFLSAGSPSGNRGTPSALAGVSEWVTTIRGLTGFGKLFRGRQQKHLSGYVEITSPNWEVQWDNQCMVPWRTGHQIPHGIEGSIALFFDSALLALSEHDMGSGPSILPGASKVAILEYIAPVVIWVLE